MSKFIPFRAVRPPRDRAHLVGTRSYVNYSKEELEDKLKQNPFTFLHIINPELHPVNHKNISHEDRFKLIRAEYDKFLDIGHFKKDEKKAFYLYRQTKEKHQFVGIIGGISVDSYRNGEIKVHEETLTKKEQLFEKYLNETRFNAEPVLLTYDDVDLINDIHEKYLKKRPEYEFHTTDEVKHELWLISKKKDQKIIKEEVGKLENIYIADGHHRSASSALLSSHLKNGSKYIDYFMSMLIPTSGLKIFDFNRLVKTMNGLSKEELLEKLQVNFHLHPSEEVIKPKSKREITMYLHGHWYSLKLKAGLAGDSLIDDLDTQILTDYILKPILGIKDLKTDNNIDFLNGLEGMEGLQNSVDSGRFKIAFALFPVSIEQLKNIADSKLMMPPKSTWIEPKLRSGLTIYEIE